jgi:hypothetical protein
MELSKELELEQLEQELGQLELELEQLQELALRQELVQGLE